MSTKIDELFATLRVLIADTSRDLAMAMAELRSVAQQRDALRNPAGATIADGGEWTREEAIEMHRRKADELLTVKAERDKLKAECDNLSEAMQRNCVQYVQKQQALIAERDAARQLMRAAEQDVAETEGINADLRCINKRLVADLADAMERLNHAESIIMP